MIIKINGNDPPWQGLLRTNLKEKGSGGVGQVGGFALSIKRHDNFRIDSDIAGW